MMTLQDRQLPIDREILRELIACTPEGWSKIDFVVDVIWDGDDDDDVYLEIQSPEGHDASSIRPSQALWEATWNLIGLMKEHNHRLEKVRGHAWLDERDRWMYRATFAYVK
jgi:hypothetical protein